MKRKGNLELDRDGDGIPDSPSASPSDPESSEHEGMTVGHGTHGHGEKDTFTYRQICQGILFAAGMINLLVGALVAATGSSLMSCTGSTKGYSICAMSSWGHPYFYVLYGVVQELFILAKYLPTKPLGVTFGSRKAVALGETVGAYLMLLQIAYGMSVMGFECTEKDLKAAGSSTGACEMVKLYILISMFMSYVRCQIGTFTFYRHAMLIDPRYDAEVASVMDCVQKQIEEEETDITEMQNATYFEKEMQGMAEYFQNTAGGEGGEEENEGEDEQLLKNEKRSSKKDIELKSM